MVASAGCNSLRGGPTTRSCRLSHETIPEAEYDPGEAKNITYDGLTRRGKEVFERTIRENGYTLRYNGSNAPSDFDYSDEATTYRIGYDDSTYFFIAYTGEGCTIP